MGNKVLGQYTEAATLPSDSIFYTVVSGVAYKTTLDAIQSGRATTVLELTDTPSSYGTTASRSDPSKYYFLSVNSANTATEFAQVRFTDLNETPSSIAGDGSDNDGQKFYGIAQGASTLTAEYAKFTGLNDVPHSYGGSAEYLVRVNTAGDGLEFIDPTTVSTAPPSSSSIGGETLPIKIPSSSSAVEQDSFPESQIRFQSNDGNHFVYSSWMKPTGFDSGKDITIDISFLANEFDVSNSRYYYNLFCVTGTTGSNPTTFDKSTDSPLLTDYVETLGLSALQLVRKRHTFSAALDQDVIALYFCLQRTNGTDSAENTTGIYLNRIGLTYHQL